MRLSKLAVPIIAFGLSTYAMAQQKSSSQEQLDRYNSIQEKSIQSLQACQAEVSSMPSTIAVRESILAADNKQSNFTQLISSGEKISEDQRKALSQYVVSVRKCRAGLAIALTNYPTLNNIVKKYITDTDSIYSSLLAKKITIGEANQELSKIDDMMDINLTGAVEKLVGDLAFQIKREAALQLKESEKPSQLTRANALTEPRLSKSAQDAIDAQNAREAEYQRAQRERDRIEGERAWQARQQQIAQDQAIKAQQDAIARDRAAVAFGNALQNIANLKAAQSLQYQSQAVPPAYQNQNTNPWMSAPQQQPIQPPVVNCNPNYLGGYRCQ